MKRISFIFTLVIISVLTLNLSACSYLRFCEEELYTQKINDFFGALDNEDAGAIKSLFSKTVIENDNDLDEQISKLISIYPKAVTSVMFDGILAGEYEDNKAGLSKSAAYAHFPVISNNEYYWTFIELIYEDDFSPNNIGLNRVLFYTADEFCLFINDVNFEFSSNIGLTVYSERTLENEVKCINKNPCEFTPIERNLKLSDVKDFLEESADFEEFTTAFGEPNAVDFIDVCYYETKDAENRTLYIEIAVEDGEIIYANLVSEFEHIECIYEIDNLA